MKKKLLISLLAILLVFTLTGCGISSSGSKKGNNVKDVEGGSKKQVKANIEETVILDKNGIKVTAKSIEYDGWMGPEIKLLVENNSDQNVMIQTRNVSINDIMIDPLFSVEVQAGKKANDSITFSSTELKDANIETIKDIEFALTVSDADSWDTLFREDGIVLHTDAKEYVQKYNTEGTLVHDQDGIKIYILKKDDKDSFWGADIYVYIENNSSTDVVVQARDVSINGFMIDPMFSSTVSSGKKAYDSITFLESDLKDNDIKDISEMELKFHIFNYDTWNTILDTDVIKITF